MKWFARLVCYIDFGFLFILNCFIVFIVSLDAPGDTTKETGWVCGGS